MVATSSFHVLKNKVIVQIRSSEQKKAFLIKFFALSCYVGFFTLESLLWFGAITTGQGFFESSTTVHAIFFFVDICSLVSFMVYLHAWSSPQGKNQEYHYRNDNLAPRKSATTSSQNGKSGNRTLLIHEHGNKAAAYYVPPIEQPEIEIEPELESEIHISQLRPLKTGVPQMETLVSINAFDELSIHDLHDFDDIEALSIMGTQNNTSVSQYPHDFTSLTNMAVFSEIADFEEIENLPPAPTIMEKETEIFNSDPFSAFEF